MSTSSLYSQAIRRVLASSARGVVGLVDDLLTVCQDHKLQLDWQANRCRVRPSGGNWDDWIDVPFRKSVIRAILARLATLCNEHGATAISPYGGDGELSTGHGQAAVFKLSLTNTSDEQKFELTPQTNLADKACVQTEGQEKATDRASPHVR